MAKLKQFPGQMKFTIDKVWQLLVLLTIAFALGLIFGVMIGANVPVKIKPGIVQL